MAVKSNLTTMVVCLTVVSLVCSALLGGMYALTAEPIAKANADILKASIGAVLPEGGELSEAKPIEVGGQASEYYVSIVDGTPVAYAVKSTTVGFGGPLVLMVGITFLAKSANIPMGFELGSSLQTAFLLLIISVMSGALTLGALKKGEPADLLK